jgi:hypothetical protein
MVSTARPIRMRDRQPVGVQDIKDQAARLRALLLDNPKDISSTQALELMARVHGFRNWGHLSAHLRGDLIRKPTPPSPKKASVWVHGLSPREVSSRMAHRAREAGCSPAEITKITSLVSYLLPAMMNDSYLCHFSLSGFVYELHRGLPDISPQASRFFDSLTAQALMKEPRLERQQVPPPHLAFDDPDGSWHRIEDLPDQLIAKRMHMAIIDQDGSATRQVLHRYRDISRILEAPFDAPPGEELVSALSGLPGAFKPDGYLCAADFTRETLSNAVRLSVLEDHPDTRPRPFSPQLLHFTLHPHMTGMGLTLAIARSLGYFVAVTVPQADYRDEAENAVSEVLANSNTLVLGGHAWTPEVHRGTWVRNPSDHPIFKTAG